MTVTLHQFTPPVDWNESDLKAFLKADRGWFRQQRVDHAWMRKRTCDPMDVNGRRFWSAVLFRLGFERLARR